MIPDVTSVDIYLDEELNGEDMLFGDVSEINPIDPDSYSVKVTTANSIEDVLAEDTFTSIPGVFHTLVNFRVPTHSARLGKVLVYVVQSNNFVAEFRVNFVGFDESFLTHTPPFLADEKYTPRPSNRIFGPTHDRISEPSFCIDCPTTLPDVLGGQIVCVSRKLFSRRL